MTPTRRLSAALPWVLALLLVLPPAARSAEEPPPAQGTRLRFTRTLSVQEVKGGKIFSETRQVEAGETLWQILTQDYRLPEEGLSAFVDAFKEVNPGVDPDQLAPGQVVRIPFKLEVDAEEPATEGTDIYTVRAGDNLWKILRNRFKVESAQMGPALDAVARANPSLTDLDHLLVGQRLAIPRGLAAASASRAHAAAPGPPVWEQTALDLLRELGCKVSETGETFLPLGRGRTARLDARDFPLVAGPTGRKVILDPAARMSAALVRAVEESWNYRVVQGPGRDAEDALARVLPYLGFSELSEGARTLSLSPGVEVLALARWTIVPRPEDLWEGKVHLIFPPGAALDPNLAEAVDRAGFRLHTLGEAVPPKPAPAPPMPVLSMGNRYQGAARLLALLGVPHRIRPEVDCDLGGGVRYQLRPELTFRYDQVDYAVPPPSPAGAPSILSRAGYFTLAWPAGASPLNVVGDLLALLGIPHARITAEVPPDQALRLRVRGITLDDQALPRRLYPSRSGHGRLFLTEAPLTRDTAQALFAEGLLPWLIRTR